MNHSLSVSSFSAFVSLAAALAVSTLSTHALAEGGVEAPTDHTVVSFGIERIAGISHAMAHPDGQATSSGTFFNIAGVVHDPLSMPRLGVDVFLPSGLGIGGAIGFSSISLTDNTGGTGQGSDTITAVLFEPRVSYRWKVSPDFDVIPRLGLSYLHGYASAPSGSSCVSTDGVTSTCASGPDNSDSLHLWTLSPEVVGVYRATRSLNVIASLSYDYVISAGSSETSAAFDQNGNPSGTSTTSSSAKGSYSAIALSVGIGGYL